MPQIEAARGPLQRNAATRSVSLMRPNLLNKQGILYLAAIFP
jgi:hypothetical protein